jgi:hypothetical protein
MPDACPRCGSWEQTQPVSAIVAAQTTATTIHSAGYAARSPGGGPILFTSRGVSSTPLADALRLRTPKPPGVGWRWFVTLFGIGWACLMGYVTFVVEESLPLYARVAAFLILGGWLPVLGIALLIRAHADRRRFRESEPLYERAAWLWYYKTRYCQHDHIVYLPGGLHDHPDRTNELVYEAARRAIAAAGTA